MLADFFFNFGNEGNARQYKLVASARGLSPLLSFSFSLFLSFISIDHKASNIGF